MTRGAHITPGDMVDGNSRGYDTYVMTTGVIPRLDPSPVSRTRRASVNRTGSFLPSAPAHW